MEETKVGQVIELIKKRLELHDAAVSPGSRLVDDLGADSLAIVELTLMIEEAFDIEISDESAGQIRTVQDVIDCTSRAIGP